MALLFLCFQIELEFEILDLVENWRIQRKNLEARTKTNNKLNHTCDTKSGSDWTQATVVGGERSHRCAIPHSPA